MNRAELGRYFNYCSELLTMVSKAAALCAEQATDPVVLDTVSEISLLHLAQQGPAVQPLT
ncbi:MAG: hypothetical protein ABJA74_09035 [Lapillicoccus sp.]